MKKNQRPIKGQKQTPKETVQKFVNPYAKPVEDLGVMQARFTDFVAQNKVKQAYNTGLDVLRRLENEPDYTPLDCALLNKLLGDLANLLQEHPATTRHFEKAIKVLEQAPPNDKFDIVEIYYHTGVSFSNLKKYDKAI